MSYTSWITISGDPFLDCLQSVEPEIAALFRDDERAAHGEKLRYTTTVGNVRDRLDALGFTVARARAALDDALHPMSAADPDSEYESYIPYLDTISVWAREGGVYPEDPPDWTRYVGEPRHILRLMLDPVDSRDEVSLILADLVLGGFIQERDDLCSEAFSELHVTSATHGPLVVLTEGSTDAEILKLAQQMLTPHLTGFMRFLDFDFKPEGGASALIRAIRAFASAGISNRIIALFDNDTSAHEALNSLDESGLPTNFKVMTLPDLPMAANYPTVGPTGDALLNVNGLAVSIEMFLGDNILRRDGGELVPVQWSGYSHRLKRYQGELMEKSHLQRAFMHRAQEALRHGRGSSEDWQDLEGLLSVLLHAFD